MLIATVVSVNVSFVLCRLHGMSYSRLINGMSRAEMEVDRKILADIAVHDPDAFGAIAEQAKAALADS